MHVFSLLCIYFNLCGSWWRFSSINVPFACVQFHHYFALIALSQNECWCRLFCSITKLYYIILGACKCKGLVTAWNKCSITCTTTTIQQNNKMRWSVIYEISGRFVFCSIGHNDKTTGLFSTLHIFRTLNSHLLFSRMLKKNTHLFFFLMFL